MQNATAVKRKHRNQIEQQQRPRDVVAYQQNELRPANHFFATNDAAEIEHVITRSAQLLNLTIDKKAVAEIAGRSRGTPRIANRLLRRVRDFAQVKGSYSLTHDHAKDALEMYEVDEQGLDRLDRSVLLALIDRFNGGPVGLSTLAIAVGEETETVESVAEPFLVRNGFMARTPRGRVATALGYTHLGRSVPPSLATLFDPTSD